MLKCSLGKRIYQPVKSLKGRRIARLLQMCCVCPDEDREMMGEGLPIILVGQDYQTARRCWGRNFLVLSVRVKLCQQEWRLVRVAKRNTDEPLVEASIVGMRC